VLAKIDDVPPGDVSRAAPSSVLMSNAKISVAPSPVSAGGGTLTSPHWGATATRVPCTALATQGNQSLSIVAIDRSDRVVLHSSTRCTKASRVIG